MAYYDPLAFQQPQQHTSNFGGDARASSLWMGELEPWMDENWIRGAWYNVGEQVSVKMIRDKYTGVNAGYCFVELLSPAAAAKAITTLNGVLIPGTNKVFKLNWASGGNMGAANTANQEHSLFVGDLSPEVTEYILMATFQERYLSCRSAKIMTDPTTGASRGYGFVRFADENEQQRALHEMQGVFCGNRPIRVSMATPKNKVPAVGMNNAPSNMNGAIGGAGYNYMPPAQPTSPQHTLNQFTDPNNTTVFVGGLSGITHEDELRHAFGNYGEITYVKIPPGKGCGFVQFVHRQSAEMAINQLNNIQIGNSRVRLSWGRAQNEPKPLSPHGQHMNSSSFRMPNQVGFGSNRNAGYNSFAAGSSFSGMMQSQLQRDPMERVPVEHQNRAFMDRKEALMDRMEDGASWRGSGAIYA
ncbi:hypothetical protein BGZ76_011420 [Entomortierella beljakovae]|nr:hypothetical protein BGZ76_011420 [Entomortierella beljakovae]